MKRLLSRIGLGLIALSTALTSTATNLGTEPETFARDLAGLVNEYRLRHGLPPLEASAGLEEIAWRHNAEMLEQRRLTHAGFRDRYEQTGSRVCVENLARNFLTPEAVLRGWQQSPSHDRNLLEPKVTRMGLAVTERYVTFFACL